MPSKATRYEQQKAKEHGAKHQGGPGKPDYTRGNVIGEVKDRKSPVTKPEIQKMHKKGVRELDSKGGVTKPALKFAKQKNIKVFSKRRTMT